MRRFVICLMALIGVSVCLSHAHAGENGELVKKFGDAFNAHDVEAMTALVSEEFQLIYFDEQGKSRPGAEGPEALRKGMATYFQSLTDVKSTYEDISEVGAFVSVKETASWTDKSGKQHAHASLAVYQVKGNKIVRTWYYPATKVK